MSTCLSFLIVDATIDKAVSKVNRVSGGPGVVGSLFVGGPLLKSLHTPTFFLTLTGY